MQDLTPRSRRRLVFQRVRLPPGKGAARQPEPSLAWRAATGVVKRRQGVTKRRGKPRDGQMMTPSWFKQWGQHRKRRNRRGAKGRPGSWTDAEPRDGSPGNLGGPVTARRGNSRLRGEPADQDSRPGARLAWRWEWSRYVDAKYPSCHLQLKEPQSQIGTVVGRRSQAYHEPAKPKKTGAQEDEAGRRADVASGARHAVAQGVDRVAECPLGPGRHHQVALAGAQAELGGALVRGKQRGDLGVGALDQ